MDEEQKDTFRRFRKFTIVQKYTLQRGYAWMQMPMMGVIFASTIKAAFPGFVNSLTRFIILILFSFISLYIAGWLDKKFKFLHEENIYTTETNPLMMEVINDVRNK
jgi:hypothetical protein